MVRNNNNFENSFYKIFVCQYLQYLVYNFDYPKEVGRFPHAGVIKSTELSGALYETKWYNYSPRIKQLISIMMVRSQKPLTMHIGPFDVLTINAGLRALRATYSYITLFLVMAPTEKN
ncbi:hypothetical protein ABEB36_013342 [Hypothenemus hampei]|uniref:Uncharacterized protein n=1 Tax=Hypothenemus hampei TaxID=57062 RepID=A0ABD1E7P5_HYPHA